MKAVWNGAVIAESDQTEVVEGNHYFPPSSIRKEYFRASDTHTTCDWKGGKANYYDIVVGDAENKDAAWYYPDTKEAADHIRDYVAFWNGVSIE